MSPKLEIVGMVAGAIFLLFGPFFALSPVSADAKLRIVVLLSLVTACITYPEVGSALFNEVKTFALGHPLRLAGLVLGVGIPLRYLQQKLRFSRVNTLKMKYGFTNDPSSFMAMTVEQAQEIETNIGEYEFPRLYQFAWISDFLRTSTDPGVSRALVNSAHMVNPDPMIEHERMQATIHLMTGFMAYKFKSAYHSLIMARINEHHHRYGTWINSDDVLYLIIHFAMTPGMWIDRLGYRKLEPFEVQAMWVFWREIGCSMGVKYVPETLEQAKEWRKTFEKKCRWLEDANEVACMAMLNETIWSIPNILKPFARKFLASILCWDIVYFCQLEKLGPSELIRSTAFDIFRLCGWFIRELGLPRMSPYKRSPDGPKNDGLMVFGHTPYDTLPFYQEQSFWNNWGYGAIVRRILGIPLPAPKFHSQGTTIEGMGLAQKSAQGQLVVEKKVREMAAVLEKAPFGYRPNIGYQLGRLVAPVAGPQYGSPVNAFTESTPLIPEGVKRFEKEYQQRAPGYNKVGVIDTPEDIVAFNENESYDSKANGVAKSTAGPTLNGLKINGILLTPVISVA